MKNKIAYSPEILTALLSADVADSADKFTADANGFITENYGVDLSGIDILVVRNTHDTVHLPLPYYTGLEELSADIIADNDLTDVDGGDISLLVGGLILAAVFSSITAVTLAAVTGIAVTIGTQTDAAVARK